MKRCVASVESKRLTSDISVAIIDEEGEVIPHKRTRTVPKSGATTPKQGIGESGVHFRYYRLDEYNKLNYVQQKELNSWRQKSSENLNYKKARRKASILSQVATQVTKEMKKIKNRMHFYIILIVCRAYSRFS